MRHARRFENTTGGASKFWAVEVDGATMRVTFGKLGAAGQQKATTFASPTAGMAAAEGLVNEKLKKGYREVAAATPTSLPQQGAPSPKSGDAKTSGGNASNRWRAKVPASELARVRAILEKAKLQHRTDALLNLLQPAIRFTLTTAKAPTAVTTRFGGAPDLPPGFTWPRAGKTPLAFVAQFRLDELTKLDLEGQLPKKGVLSVFALLAFDDSEMTGEKGQLLFFPDATTLVRTAPAHSAKADGRPSKTALATPGVTLTLPRAPRIRLTDDEEERYVEQVLPALEGRRAAHQLLGWSSESGLPSKSLQLLGQIDTDRRFGFDIGDDEALRLWISPTKLAKGDFKRTMFSVHQY